ncbi:MAG: histidine phosphatase family protein [Acidobacteria bacterium]|nr:histidine phosphatase family protein [Acidobacteriota bacterium]
MKRLLLAWLLAAGLLAQDAVVILLRHAEKTHRGDTAELTAAGQRRAAALPQELLPYRPVALFASDLRRSQQTLAPLSTRLGVPVQIYQRGQEATLGASGNPQGVCEFPLSPLGPEPVPNHLSAARMIINRMVENGLTLAVILWPSA